MDFLSLCRHGLPPITDPLERCARENGLTNVFNPSVVVRGTTTHVAMRAQAVAGEKPFRAYYVTIEEGGEYGALVDLTSFAALHGIRITADPKLVELDGHMHVTFNTGNVHEGQNEIYLQRLEPELTPPQRCGYAARRQVEKNWGFYTLPSGGLGVVYTLAPLTLLSLRSGRLGTTDDLEFVATLEAPMPVKFPRLHIGSQPLLISPTEVLVAANQQWPIPGLPRKVYLGRLAQLNIQEGRMTRLSRRRLIHSWSSMLPQRRRHNPGLFSATYFAGLSRTGTELMLSYGVNDVSLGVARLPEHLLWS